MSDEEFRAAVQQEIEHLSRVHPTPEDIPSCFNLLEKYFKCGSATSQFKSLYRYGHMAECSDKMADFKFCLGLRSLDAEQKRKAWIEHRAEWWAHRRLNGSSEDVWEMRKTPIEGFPPPPPNFKELSEPVVQTPTSS